MQLCIYILKGYSLYIIQDFHVSCVRGFLAVLFTIIARNGSSGAKGDKSSINLHVASLQSHPALWDPMDYSLPGSSVHKILQARTLEWAAMPSSTGSSPPRDGTQSSYVPALTGRLFTNSASRTRNQARSPRVTFNFDLVNDSLTPPTEQGWGGGGFPWWLSGKESACQCRRQGFSPWSGNSSHAREQLSWCITTTQPVLWSLEATTTGAHAPWSPCSTGEATAVKSPSSATGEWPLRSAAREKPEQQRRLSPAKTEINNLKKNKGPGPYSKTLAFLQSPSFLKDTGKRACR